MIALTLYVFFFVLIAVVGVFAGWSDFRGLRIPNWHSGVVLAAFVLAYMFMWFFGRDDVFSPLQSHLLSALLFFAVTLVMFAFGGLGAADSKLGTAYALWVGLSGLVVFLFYMALVGGVLALVALVLRKWPMIKSVSEGSWIDCVQSGQSKVPYGIAIVAGALASFVKIGYFDLEVLSSFLLFSG